MKLYEHDPYPHTAVNVNDLHHLEHAKAGFNQRFAVAITKVFGSIWAFYILVAWMFGWMILASAGVWLFAKDAYPYPFLLFLSNLVQLFALPILGTGQAVLGRKQELQADEQFLTTMKTYHDIEEIMAHLSAQDEELLKQTYLSQQQNAMMQQLLTKSTPRKKATVAQ